MSRALDRAERSTEQHRTPDDDRPVTSSGRRYGRARPARVGWWATFAIVSILGGLWALADPLFSVPDEPAHAVYAAAAVRGELFAPTKGIDTTVTVPTGYATAGTVGACFIYNGTVPAGCAKPYVARPGSAQVVTTAGRYPPAYYLYVGTATLVADGATAIYLMRLLTVILCAALLASAFASARHSRSPWPVTGVALALTPMVLFFLGAVNPQGPEIAAGIGLWSTGLALLSDHRGHNDAGPSLDPRLLVRCLLAGGVLAVIRPMSIVWLALIVGVVLLARAQLPTTRALLRHRGALVGGLGLGLLVLVTAAWILDRHALAQWSRPNDSTLVNAALFSVSKLNRELHEMVGVFGWLDTWAPEVVYLIWFGVVGTLLILAAAVASRRERLALAAVVLTSLVVPVASELASYHQSGFAWQGRYILAFSAGLTVLSGYVIAGQLPAGLAAKICRGVLVTLGTAQVIAFIGNLNRYVHGVNSFWFAGPTGWRPPLPAVVLIGFFIAATAAAVALLFRVLGEEHDLPEHAVSREDRTLVGRSSA